MIFYKLYVDSTLWNKVMIEKIKREILRCHGQWYQVQVKMILFSKMRKLKRFLDKALPIRGNLQRFLRSLPHLQKTFFKKPSSSSSKNLSEDPDQGSIRRLILHPRRSLSPTTSTTLMTQLVE